MPLTTNTCTLVVATVVETLLGFTRSHKTLAGIEVRRSLTLLLKFYTWANGTPLTRTCLRRACQPLIELSKVLSTNATQRELKLTTLALTVVVTVMVIVVVTSSVA